MRGQRLRILLLSHTANIYSREACSHRAGTVVWEVLTGGADHIERGESQRHQDEYFDRRIL